MPAIAWLGLAVAAGAGAYVIGWPAWTAYRGRAAQDTNAERYLAWRGRASRTPRTPPAMSPDERRRVYAGVGLAAVAVLALIGFFVAN